MSSKALSKEKLGELVKCVLCMKTFTSPKIMTCRHTFCKHCLEIHAKRSSVDDVQGLECPQCKHFTAQSDVTACTHAEQLLALHQRATNPKLCYQCETESAKWKCQDCGEFYCLGCKEMHFKIKQFRDHNLFEISDVEEEISISERVNCTEHGSKEVEFFCFDCNALLCSLCLLEGHGTHKRDTVHNAVDHVKAKVDEKLAAVKQITDDRFLQAEKLKDTRLLIQSNADESFDAIKSRYEFLKQKLEDDYKSLTQKLTKSVDAELEKVNAAIVAEEAKLSHATAVTSYVENTLVTTTDAMLIHKSIQQLIPTMNDFCDVIGDSEPLETSQIYRFRKAESLPKLKNNIIGEIETIEASFYSRYQPVITKEQLESATVGKSIDINLDTEAKSYRISVGYGKILVCVWNIDTILVYSSNGTEYQRLDLSDELDEPRSAVFVNAFHIVVAAENGLALVDLTTSSVVSTIAKDRYSDVCCFSNTLLALNIQKKTVDLIRKNGKEWILEPTSLTFFVKTVHAALTTVALPNYVNIYNHDNEVFQCSFSGELLQTVTVDEHEPANPDRFLCAMDSDGRMLLVDGGQLVLQHNDQSQVVQLEGVRRFQDVVFEDHYSFWILELINLKQGQYKLTKYTIYVD